MDVGTVRAFSLGRAGSGAGRNPRSAVAFIGRSPGEEHLFIVSGDSGQGITNGLVAGMLIADLIMTDASPWEDVYAPARKIQKNIGEFISENITPLENLAEYLTASEIASVERLRPRGGAACPQRPEKDRGVPGPERTFAPAFGKLHPSRLRRALECAGAVLGLPVPRVAVCTRRHRAQRPCCFAARRGRQAGQS